MIRLESIQFLRGLAAFVVLLFHVCILSTDYTGGVFFAPFIAIGSAGVDLFFVISGFVMVATTYENFDRPGTATRFAVHRLSRIYPPYWILSGVLLIYYIYNPAGVNSKQGGADLAASFLLTPSSFLPLLPVAWTLMHEILFYVVFFAALCILPRRLLGKALLIWAAGILINIALSEFYSSAGLHTFLLHPFNLEFIAGALVGLSYKKNGFMSRRFSIICMMASVALFVGVAIYFQISGQQEVKPVPLRILFFGIPSLLLFVGCASLNFERRGFWGIFTRMGDYSYSLYLTHILLVHLAYRVATKKFNVAFNFQGNGIFAILLMGSCVFLGWCFYSLVEKPSCATFLRFIDKLIKNKNQSLQHPQ
jgi:peptidoglycan/LPS O-acetylase OafA/YrhL